jgi:iron complex transport system substrate-binding protein
MSAHRIAAVLAVLAVAIAAPAAYAEAFVLRDDAQRQVTFAREPRRIITLLPSLTETVCALDACDRLVATDRYSNFPAQVEALPKAGDLDEVAVELIVSLRPDLVLLSRSHRITERLADLGIQSFVLNSETYADIARSIKTVGRILGASARADTLERSIAAAVEDIGAKSVLQRHGATPAVYFEVDRAPYAAGPASFIGELLTRLGTRNIVTPDLGAFPKLNPEYVVRHAPDVIFIAASDAQELAERPGWGQLRAVKERRFCSFPSRVTDTIVRPGPRVAEGMSALAGCLARVAP